MYKQMLQSMDTPAWIAPTQNHQQVKICLLNYNQVLLATARRQGRHFHLGTVSGYFWGFRWHRQQKSVNQLPMAVVALLVVKKIHQRNVCSVLTQTPSQPNSVAASVG